MKVVEHERQDWSVVIIILILGLLFVLLAGQWALRVASGWQMNASMQSLINPNTAFLTSRPNGFIESIDPSILTQPSWINDFLTPGVSLTTRTPFATQTRTFPTTQTIAPSMTNTLAVTGSSTNTLVYLPVTRTPTSRPRSTSISTSTLTTGSTTTITSAPPTNVSQTATATSTATVTATSTFTPSASPTPSNTPIPYPPEIGVTPDGDIYPLTSGGSLVLSINLVANGDPNYDLVYYERPAPAGGINLDWIIVEIGDGTNWYTVFNWSDDVADTNSNMDFNGLSLPIVPPRTLPPFQEPDERNIDAVDLYVSPIGFATGIAIDVDSLVPPGTYTLLRFTAPAGDSDGQTEIDALEILP